MSAADIFDDVLTNDPEVKEEASNYDGQQESDRDLDTPAGKDEPMSPQPDADMDDLFGDDKPADEVIHHQEAITPASSEHADGISSPDRRHREALEYAEEDEPEQDIVEEEVLEASAQIPNIPVPRSSDGKHWVIRIPNFIKVDSKPFHPDTYIGPEQEEEAAHVGESSREKDMSIKLRVENTMRWRWVKDEHGQDHRQSNSRIIRWSDGSLSLKLGKELFDITQTIDTSGAVPRQAIGGSTQSSQQASQAPAVDSKAGIKAQGLTYLVAQHKRAEILQCEAMITGTMSLRPTGMQSETHRMLVRAVGQKHTKVARLRMAPDPTMDPEREQRELLRQASRKTRKPKGDDDGLGGARRRRTNYPRKRSGDDMWSDDDDDDGFAPAGASDDEYGGGAGPSARKAKRRKADDGEEAGRRGPGEYQNDDFLVADSEEDADFAESDEGEGRRPKKRRARHHEEEDDLDKLEAKIEAEERKRRQQERTTGSDAAAGETDKPAAGEAMDVESEEDEEEWGVRRAGAGSRRKRAIDFDEEDED
ncbi:Leo1 domain-containing protein [Phanerochaete sordida]|uniref:Leo1 domain-containing protein n=1 Tax=Phanerochaete sordida TaxID=48140 RepID=A0A9P3GAD9_9APHY|nr:Leo1 domain-containing protein [Phanerochaete sordida]